MKTKVKQLLSIYNDYDYHYYYRYCLLLKIKLLVSTQYYYSFIFIHLFLYCFIIIIIIIIIIYIVIDLAALQSHRDDSIPLITVSNHIAALDDPLMIASIMDVQTAGSPKLIRYDVQQQKKKRLLPLFLLCAVMMMMNCSY